jgi:hypothetical protein
MSSPSPQPACTTPTAPNWQKSSHGDCYHRRNPQPAPAPGWAATAAAARAGRRQTRRPRPAAQRTLHHPAHAHGRRHDGGRPGTLQGVTPLPACWLRASAGRWHATRTWRLSLPGDHGEVRSSWRSPDARGPGTPWIHVAAAGESAEVCARLPLSWK